MERTCKIILVCLIATLSAVKCKAIDLKPPADVGTLEILIDAHKVMKEAELKALAKIETNKVEQSFITKSTKRYNEVKKVLNTKMKDANSYLLLASSIMKITLNLKRVGQEYAAFTKNSVKYVSDSPLASAYYADANYQIGKEVKHAYKLIANYSAAGFNLLTASNDEKIKMIFLINMSVSKIRDLIYHADLMMRTLIRTGFDVMYISDILTTELCNDISNKLTKQWNQQCE